MKLIHIVGARPNFMKAAPLLRALAVYPHVQNLLVHTGQHYDENMSDVFFDDLHLPRPDINLGVGSGSHAEQTANVMLRFEPVLLEHKPDGVVVFGDVNSTIACALVAAKLHIPVVHVEAGVRSFDRMMPEEINRVLTDALADLCFTPSREANDNLRREGIAEEKIHFAGNVMVDALLEAAAIASQRESWTRWNLHPQGYAVTTLHRAANVDDPATLARLLSTLSILAIRIPIVFPIHPRTAKRLVESGIPTDAPGLILTEPLGYLDFLCLMSQAKLVLSDSGGIQSETSMLGVPCLTLRANTEWGVTLTEGTNILVGDDPERILAEADKILRGESRQGRRPEFWDGQAAQRIAKVLAKR